MISLNLHSNVHPSVVRTPFQNTRLFLCEKLGGTFHQGRMDPGPQRVALFLGVATPECLYKQLQLAKHNY